MKWSPVTPHVAVWSEPSVQAYLLNVKALKPHILLGQKKMPTGTLVAATANYSDKGVPIGPCMDEVYSYKSLRRLDKTPRRPMLAILEDKAWIGYGPIPSKARAVLLAGPTLVRCGTDNLDTKFELFQADAVRRADHVAYGVTSAGKLVVAYFRKASLEEMAAWFVKQRCTDAIKADGGSQAFLAVPGENLRLGNPGIVPVALSFTERSGKVK